MPRRNGVFILEPVIERVDLTDDFEGLWVEMNVTPSAKDYKQWSSEDGALHGLMTALRAWNLADEKGKPLPITLDTLETLPIKLIGVLTQAFGEHTGVPKATADA